MDSLIDIYKYFAKFPEQAAIEHPYKNKGADFSYAAWNTQLANLETDIPNFAEELLPDIENFFFGASLSDQKLPQFRGMRNLALMVWWTEITNEQSQFDYRNGIASMHVAAIYQYSMKSLTEIEALILDNQCNNILIQIEEQMKTDSDGTCPRLLQQLEYPIGKRPIKYHNYAGVVMDVNMGTKRDIL